MGWVLIGYVAGSLVTSTHATHEDCDGRIATLKREYKIEAKCVEAPVPQFSLTTGTVLTTDPRCHNINGFWKCD